MTTREGKLEDDRDAEAGRSALLRLVARRGPISRVVGVRLDASEAMGVTPEQARAILRAWLDELRWR